ncbi:uncharacterized protein KY384_004035 [Bacidia gigantensis]|uniref:uncharacterized protein n=1 Tax=Bacidia gigantensis TaxID=2732470 RepID=UPI001D0589E7|nr:uncharacterized protein KY384_004035 [Bacidia gigantensis]KAG8530680.1 hypothetical protein KY384_004035 [Bacidia gigantensis]
MLVQSLRERDTMGKSVEWIWDMARAAAEGLETDETEFAANDNGERAESRHVDNIVDTPDNVNLQQDYDDLKAQLQAQKDLCEADRKAANLELKAVKAKYDKVKGHVNDILGTFTAREFMGPVGIGKWR